MKESAFSKKVIKKLKEIPNTFVIRTQAGSIGGIPDLIICCSGYFFAWELKTTSKVTKLQEHTLGEITKANGYAYVVNPGNFEASLNEMKRIAGIK